MDDNAGTFVLAMLFVGVLAILSGIGLAGVIDWYLAKKQQQQRKLLQKLNAAGSSVSGLSSISSISSFTSGVSNANGRGSLAPSFMPSSAMSSMASSTSGY